MFENFRLTNSTLIEAFGPFPQKTSRNHKVCFITILRQQMIIEYTNSLFNHLRSKKLMYNNFYYKCQNFIIHLLFLMIFQES